ncbi:MAG: cysteine--tRNA ligase [Candidatus Omnitrophota bacterium]
MPIQIYNSLTRKKESFEPLKAPQVNMYTCGVTVYDECHIGHARSLYIFDVIRRYLEYRGFKVNFVRNITDIDDKIINRANELKCNWQELVDKYIKSYYEDLESLGVAAGIKDGDAEPRATKNIPQIIRYIAALIHSGFAYVTDTGVYFSVRKFKDYGKLSGQGIDDMLSGVRKESDEAKVDPLDFALWKKSKPGDPSWESPWGAGRPGWHIECSTMSQKYLRCDTLDIHAGGRDLIFPHHENEIAQAESATGKQFAKYWIHHGLLTINSQKMSKSLGNFITIKDFLAKYKDADILKLFFLSAHYSHPIDYSEKKIEETIAALERIHILIDKIDRVVISHQSPVTSESVKEIEDLRMRFVEAMDDDFNAPQALACVFDLVNLVNKRLGDGSLREPSPFIFSVRDTLKEFLSILGISLEAVKTGSFSDEEITLKIAEREEARKNKNYALSDQIRKDLEAQGIILEDEKGVTTWRRKL